MYAGANVQFSCNIVYYLCKFSERAIIREPLVNGFSIRESKRGRTLNNPITFLCLRIDPDEH